MTPGQDALQPTAPGGHQDAQSHGSNSLLAMAFGSVGVVYGDIGTSPLYALRESLVHASSHGAVSERDVIGVVSLLIWALFLIVTIKYVIFIMRADNKGEGGTLALMALAQKVTGRRSGAIFVLGIVGAALFTGDAIITPAISVLSAVEGVKLVTPHLEHYVTLIALVILITLFLVQSKGTAGIARWFSPIMMVWFVCIAILGIMHVGDAPRILNAFNPLNALAFLLSHGIISFVVMGSVFLAVTGAEALYADMGHFGRKPIQLAWICFVLPALVLNYLGQGALILDNPKAIENPFFLLAPEWALLPLVVLATAATVIASQATITGAYSLARQAIQLGLLPRLEIQHTSDTQEGQIYIPRVNRILLIGVVLLVLIFRTSSALASAYGIAVTASMIVDSCLIFFVAWHLWRWPLAGSILFASVFLIVEFAFFASNILKLMDGGYVPVLIGGVMVLTMWTWLRGTHFLESKTRRDAIPTRDLIRMLEKSKPIRVPGTAIFLTQDVDSAPSALMHNLKHNKVLHERVFLVSVQTENIPRVPREYRYEIEKLSEDFTKIRLHYGFMESPRVPAAMALMRKSGLKFDIMTTSFFLGRRTLKESPTSGMPIWQDRLYIALSKQAANATDFFSIPSDRVVELGAQVKI
ncbi:MAG: potassium transporter Kup [Rhizobiales bacterium 62-17]|nr:potassium transporter Kup [Hyphomicrobiales bacterium]OJY00535.1 MAG: potassium transporter Kup [Rhizobiales bacterium 62-17]